MKHLIPILFLSILLFQNCKTNKSSFKSSELEKHPSLTDTGFTQDQLNELTALLKKDYETTGMLVLQNGKVVYEYGNIKEVSYIASCRKSVLSILYGKYVENGTIDLEQTIGDIGIDEKDGLLPKEKEARVDHIITSRSGVFHIPANGGYDERNILKRGSKEPGEYFVYNNWDFNVAGYILENKTGNSIYKELENQLAIPLGFQDWNIKNQKKKHNSKKSQYPAYHMYLSTRDMAKIGQLMLNEGKWNGQQIISKNWIKKITTTVTPVEVVNQRYGLNSASDVQSSYSYMWWLVEYCKGNPDFKGAYTASGFGGQYITVIPKLNVVIAHKTKLPLSIRWGLKQGGVSEYNYWKMLYQLIANKKSLSTLHAQGKTIDGIIELAKKENLTETEYDLSESEINNFGYQLMAEKDYKSALKIFQLNTELYPNGSNTYDSYGECLMKIGKNKEAIEAYKKSLKLNPNNSNAQKMIAELGDANS